jgi:RhtB (resistance to homoserine/threonine) family protein
VTLIPALAAFVAAAVLLSITPGLDTAMVLRTAAAEGGRKALMATLGIAMGCLVWGVATALGLSVLLAASKTAYTVLKWAGAAYLVWLGVNLILKPRDRFETAVQTPGEARKERNWLLRGFLTNILNPKVGVFYVSFLPQFVPAGFNPPPFILLLAVIHAVVGSAWLCLLILAMRPLKAWLARPGVVRWLDRVTGLVFVGFGLRLALERR